MMDDIGVGCIKSRLGFLHETIVGWDSDQSMIWDREPEVACQFLTDLDEVRQIVDDLGEGQEVLKCLGHDILQIGMLRLEEEFVHVLIQNQQPAVLDHMSFRSTEDDSVEDFSSSSFDEESTRGKIQSESSRCSEEYVIDMIHPDAIVDLKSITQMMFLCNYDKECCQAYISVRKDVLDECLSVLGMERLSIEEVIQMDWCVLNSMIKRWNRALKVFVRVFLASERRLCDLIFGDLSGAIRDCCFRESSKSSMLQLLTFGEAIAMGPLRPDKLFRILAMYEGLADLILDVKCFFPEDYGSFIVAECHEVLFRLGECVRGTFVEFKNAIRNDTSSTPFSSGGVHPLTKYVMNYIMALAAYSETLNLLLKGKDENDRSCSTPLARQLQSVSSILEENLDARSMLYKEDAAAIQNLFKMNNICYMVKKVQDSDLQAILGDDWIRAYSRKFRLYAMNYERASWSSVLAFLKDDGICNHGSSTPSRTVLKERFKNFNLAFEEVYRTQTGWIIPNLELREDLKISISQKVLQAYWTFVGRYASHLDDVRHRDNYLKYCLKDLEACLLDLFEGVPKVMHPHRR